MKPISTRQHGVVDYVTSASLLAMSRRLRASRRVAGLLGASAVSVLSMSAMTNYELGLVRVVPMKVHLAIDMVTGATFLAASLLFRDESREARQVLAGLGLMSALVTLLTQTESTAGA